MVSEYAVRAALGIGCSIPAMVTVDAAVQSPVPRWVAQEVGRIPGSSSTHQLSYIGGIERTSAGRIVVLAPIEQALFVFDREGRFLRSIGRGGEGPGEFAHPTPLGRIGDTLWVGDPVLRRISLFTEEGRLTRTISVLDGGQPWLLSNGDVLVVPGVDLSASAGTRHRILIERIAQRDRKRSIILDAPAPYRVFGLSLGGTKIVGPQQFDDGPRWAVATDGGGAVYADQQADQPRGRTIRVWRVDLNGRTVFDVKIPFTPQPVNHEVVEAEVIRMAGRMRAQFGALPVAAAQDLVRHAVFVPRTAPTVTRLFSSQDGRTWIRREAAVSGQVRWTVLDPTGAVSFEVFLPAEAEVHWAQADRVYAALSNSDDVPDAVEYRLRW
jgi:hypothetical protein